MRKALLITVCATTLFTRITMAEIAKGSDCGEDCSWSISDDGVLTISGSGEVNWEGAHVAPWNNYASSITSAVISEGITATNSVDYFLGGNVQDHITSLSIPNSMTQPRFLVDGRFELQNLIISDTALGYFIAAGAPPSDLIDGSRYADALRDLSNLESYVSRLPSYLRGQYQTQINNLRAEVAAAAENLRGKQNVQINCMGDIEICKSIFASIPQSSYWQSYLDIIGNDFFVVNQAPYSKKQSDGSIAYYGADGKLKAYKGKRIYTIDEANKVAGPINRVSIKYR